VILAIDQGTSGTTCIVFDERGGRRDAPRLMKFQADVLGVPVVAPEVSETTALGAAYLAGVATGCWSESDVRSMWRQAARYEPSTSEERREELLAGWRRALGVTRRPQSG
jgi:glycerol kinase